MPINTVIPENILFKFPYGTIPVPPGPNYTGANKPKSVGAGAGCPSNQTCRSQYQKNLKWVKEFILFPNNHHSFEIWEVEINRLLANFAG